MLKNFKVIIFKITMIGHTNLVDYIYKNETVDLIFSKPLELDVEL